MEGGRRLAKIVETVSSERYDFLLQVDTSTRPQNWASVDRNHSHTNARTRARDDRRPSHHSWLRRRSYNTREGRGSQRALLIVSLASPCAGHGDVLGLALDRRLALRSPRPAAQARRRARAGDRSAARRRRRRRAGGARRWRRRRPAQRQRRGVVGGRRQGATALRPLRRRGTRGWWGVWMGA